jgi:hypothetical protein
MPRGGFRPGAGRKKGMNMKALAEERAVSKIAARAGMTPLEYMLSVMNDESADDARRDRMAQAAAPYVHEKPGDSVKGKKEERQEAAKRAATGIYAVPDAPRVN